MARKKTELTKDHIRALEWIRDNAHHRARWMVGTAAAYGPPETWTHIELFGVGKKIRIKEDVMKDLTGLIHVSKVSHKMWDLSPKGKRSLKACNNRGAKNEDA